MAKLTNLDLERKKYARKKTIKRLLALLLVAAIVFIVYQLRYEIATDGLEVWATDKLMELTNTNEFPAELASEPRQILPIGKRVAVIGQTELMIYNSSGSQVLNERLGYQNPIAQTSGRKILIYDRGGYRLNIRMGERKILDRSYDFPLAAAALASDGKLAVATGSTGYLSQVIVTDENYTSIPFTWNSSKVLASVLAFDPHARLLAIGGVSTEGGVLCSTITVFEIESGKELYHIRLEDELILSLAVRDSGEVTAVTDRSAVAVTQKGEVKGRYSFGGEQIDAFVIDPDGSAVVAYGDFQSSHRTILASLSGSMQKLHETTSERKVTSLMKWGKGVVAFTGDRCLRFTPELTLAKVIDTNDASHALVVGDQLYYVTTRELHKLLIS